MDTSLIKAGLINILEETKDLIIMEILKEIPTAISLNSRPIKNYIMGDRSEKLHTVVKNSINVYTGKCPKKKIVIEFTKNEYNHFE